MAYSVNVGQYQPYSYGLFERKSFETEDVYLEGAIIEHEFSSPWEDSDLVLVVEDQKLHVHRSILKMASPVFKAMLSSNFKEKDANEITLPGKKVNEFVDFLRLVYPQLESQLTLVNVKYIYALADEYQIPKMMKDCRMFLSSVAKTKENAMDMLVLAQDMEAEEVRQQCYDVLKKMTLTEVRSQKSYSCLDGQSVNNILLPLVMRYEKCMTEAVPELLGSLDAMMYLWRHKDNKCKMNGVPSECTKYHSNPYVIHHAERIQCNICRGSFSQMALNAKGFYDSPSKTYLSENIVRVLEEMIDLTKDRSS